MDIAEAINTRRSIRWFKPDPVPRKTLEEIMTLSLRAPSWANTQPWEFAIVTGKKLEEIRQGFLDKANADPYPDLARPFAYPEPYDSRRRALGKRQTDATKVVPAGQLNEEARRQMGSRLYGSPCIICLYTDRAFYQDGDKLNVWPVYDAVLISENIMLLAVKYGLGTIPAIQLVKYPDVLRRILGLSDSKLMVLGIGIGYPDWDFTLNNVSSLREPLENVTKWYGFE